MRTFLLTLCLGVFLAGQATPTLAAPRKAASVKHKSVKASKNTKKMVYKPGKRPTLLARQAKPNIRQVAQYEPLRSRLNEDLQLYSNAALIFNESNGQVLFAKNEFQPASIASITKLMTAMVVLDANQPLDETLTVVDEDVDTLKNSSSRLGLGTTLTRREILLLALMSSENRAAASLARNYPGGLPGFVAAMNRKVQSLGMRRTRFYDATGLDSRNASTASDLVTMVQAAHEYPMIRRFSTMPSYDILTFEGKLVTYRNTNALVHNPEWEIGLQKTGFIREAGKCLVMQAKIANTPVVIVLLDSNASAARLGDANRIKQWMESRAH